jgi:hypothetical protein
MRYVSTSRSALPALFLVLTLTACSEPTGNSGTVLEPQLSRGAGVANLPFAGRCETVISPPASTPTGQTMTISGVCQMRGIGRVYMSADQTVTFTADGLIVENTATYTSPSGDELHASFSGTGAVAFPVVTFNGTETFAGGTGKFANAAGTAQLDGSARLDLLLGSFVTSGSLTF